MHLVLASLMKVSSANINLHLYWKLNVRSQYIAHLFSNNKQFSLSRIFLVKSVDGEPWQNEFSLTGLRVQNYHAGFWTSSETQGQIVGARESLNGRKNVAQRKVKNGKKSPWRPFGTGLVRHCPQGLFSPFFTFLRSTHIFPSV